MESRPYTEEVSAARAAASAPSTSPFVGRGDELHALDAALADAARGRGRVVLVAGDAGIGKTRLVEEALAARGVTASWGRCREGQGTPAYWPWTQALRALAESIPAERLRAQLGRDAALLARLLPQARALAPDADHAASRSADAEQLRFALFDAVAGWLASASTDAPVVLALDDLHWADSESLLLLRFLAAEITSCRVAVIGTQREIEARQLPAAPRLLADTARLGTRILLRGLEPGDVATLVHADLGDVPDEAVRAVQRASEGNPFFVRELTALLARDGWSAPGLLVLPEEIREVIRRRLDPLAPDVRRLLGVASVLGREFSLPLAAAVADLPSADALARFASAVETAVLREAGAVERYRFAHALVHDTVYEDLPVAERAALHARAASVLEERNELDGDSYAGEIAHHLFRAADRAHVERAVGYAIRAGDLASATLGYEEAAGHYERALEAQVTTGRPLAERLPLLLRFGDAQIGAADVDGFRATFLEAARIARELGDATSLAQAALGHASLRDYAAPDVTSIGMLEEARDALDDGDSVLRANVLGRLASASYYVFPARERERLIRDAIAMGRRVGDRDALSRILLERYHVLVGPDDTEERLAASLETARLATEGGAIALACEARLQAHADLVMLDDLPGADVELAAAERDAAEVRFGYHRWRLVLTRAMRAMMAGDHARAEACANEALAVARATVATQAALQWAGQLIVLRRMQGRLDEVAAVVDAAVAKYPATFLWRSAVLVTRAERGDLAGARTLLDQMAANDFADVPRDFGWMGALAGIADTCGVLGDARRAATLYPMLLPYARLNVTLAHSFGGPVARLLGVLALVRGDVPAAIAHFEDALARCVRLGAAPEEVRSAEGLARALLARDAAGDRARAAGLVERARHRGEALGLGGPLAALASVPLRATAPVAVPRDRGHAPEGASTARRARLVRDGAIWRVACGAEAGDVKHTKGMLYLQALLAAPGTGIASAELERRDEGERRGDATATAATLRQTLLDLRAELAEADAWSDVGRADTIREQIEDVADRLTGGAATASDDTGAGERARLNVTRALHAALRRIEACCPDLGRHLAGSVRTGNVCVYEPSDAISWEPSA